MGDVHGECPVCGSRVHSVIDRGVQWGQRWDDVVCGHCGTVRRVLHPRASATKKPRAVVPAPLETEGKPGRPPLPVVPFVPVVCPYCGSTETRVLQTMRPERRHECKACGGRFRSVEEVV